MENITTELAIILLLILANSLFAMSEMAIVSARKTRLQQRAEAGSKGALAALKLNEEPTRFLSTVQVGITLIGILSGAFGGATIADELAAVLAGYPWLAPYSQALGVLIVVIPLTYLSLVIGELVPKRIALSNADALAIRVAAPMNRLARLATPLVAVLSVSTEAVLRLLGIRPAAGGQVTEEDIKMMIFEGTQVGVFEEAEQEIVARVFRLGDRKVSSLMTHRTEMVWLDVNDTLDENLAKVIEAGHSRYLVCDEVPDDVLGVVQVKDLFVWREQGQALELRALLRPALFVPEAMAALELLETFRRKKSHFAVVVDEYGGIAGLVTINDVLEAIVGDIPTVEDQGEPDVVRREDGSLLLDGGLPVEVLKELLDLDELPGEDEDGYDTIGGMLMAQLERIPSAGDTLDWRGWRFEVMDMDGYRVDKVLASPRPSP